MVDDTPVHCVNWIDNRKVECFVQLPPLAVERNVVAAAHPGRMVVRYGMHRVDLTGAFQKHVVGTAHTWSMAANSSSRRQELFHMPGRSSYFLLYHFRNVGRSCLTSLSNVQYDNM